MAARSLRRLIASDTASVLVYERSGQAVGYAAVLFRKTSRMARLYSLAIRGNARGKGLGRVLLTGAECAAKRKGCTGIRLEVRPGNSRAIGLYHAFRYDQIGLEDAYYQDGGAALRLQKIFQTDASG